MHIIYNWLFAFFFLFFLSFSQFILIFWVYGQMKYDDCIVIFRFASHLMVCLLLWMLQSSQWMWQWPSLMYFLEILRFLLPSKLLSLMVWQQFSNKFHFKLASCIGLFFFFFFFFHEWVDNSMIWFRCLPICSYKTINMEARQIV